MLPALPESSVPPTKPRWRKWIKWTGIGCAGWFGLMLLLGIIGSNLQPSPPTAPKALTPAQDTVAVALVADSMLPDSTGAALPTATPMLALPPAPPAQAKPEKSITVYTTNSGEKYHRAGCSSLRKSSYATSLTDARAAGYEPCRRCKPSR